MKYLRRLRRSIGVFSVLPLLWLKQLWLQLRLLSLLLLLIIGVAISQLALSATAYADTYAEKPAPPTSLRVIRELPENAEKPVVVLYIQSLTWKQLQEASAQQGSIAFLDASALGNLSAPSNWGISILSESKNVGLYECTVASGFANYMEDIQYFIDNILPENGILVMVTAPVFAGRPANDTFTPIIIYGEGFSGFLTSDITHRRGLVTSSDIVLLAQVDPPQSGSSQDSPQVGSQQDSPQVGSPQDSPHDSLYLKATIRGIPTDLSTIERIQRLNNEKITIESVLQTKQAANFAFLTLVFIALAFSIVLFFLGRRSKPGSRGVLVPITRIIWLIVLAFPIATFLMFTYLPDSPSPADLVIAMVVWVTIISLFALLIGLRTKWVNSLFSLFTLMIVVIVAGQLFGGPIDTAGYLTYDITAGSRYYGLGNEQGALLFGSWITFSGLLINRYPDAFGIPFFKKWGFLLGSVFLLFVATSPWFGASFGPLVWGTLGCFFCWWLFNNRRLRWWIAILALLGSLGLALGVLYADIALNPVSHMNQVIPIINEGLWSLIVRLASDVWSYSFNLIRVYVPVVTIIFIVFLFILLVVLRIVKPGPYREFWLRNKAFAVAYSVCCFLAVVTFVIEDSGLFTPAALLIYPIAAFVWLVCDLHSWHLRILAEGGDPLSLRELQQQALGLLTPRAKGKVMQQNLDTDKNDFSENRIVGSRECDKGTGDRGTGDRGTVSFVTLSSHTANDKEEETQPSVARSTATMSVATLLSRFTGLIRTVAMAMALGNTLFTSEYYIANNLPNMLYELVAGGVLTTAFLPIYLAQLEKRGRDGAAKFSSNLLSISAIALSLVVLLATIFAPQVIFTQSFITPNLNIESATFFFRFFAIQVLFYGIGAIIGGLLNAHRRFLWPALGPVFNNVVGIITFVGYPFIAQYDPFVAKIWLALGTTLGVVAMFVVQLPALFKLKIPLRFHINLRDPALVDTLKMALPATAFIVMNIVAFSMMNNFALAVTGKGPATISYAWLWYQLPYGVIAVALSTALLTEMSKASAAENWDAFRTNVRLGLRTTLFLIFPLAAIIMMLSMQLAGLYHAGAFTSSDVKAVADLVAMWCLALPFYASYMFIYRIFSAKRDLKRFIIIDAFGRVLLIALYGFFTTGFGLWRGLGLVGIPLADACVNALLCALMLFVLRKELGSFGLTGIIWDSCKTLVAALIAIAVPYMILLGDFEQSQLMSLTMIALFGTFSLVVFYLIARLLKIPETAMINSLASRVVGLLRRKK